MKIKKVFKIIGIIESGIHLEDLEGNTYVWVTKNYNSKIFFLPVNTLIEASATIINTGFNCTYLKNLRLIKKGH